MKTIEPSATPCDDKENPTDADICAGVRDLDHAGKHLDRLGYAWPVVAP